MLLLSFFHRGTRPHRARLRHLFGVLLGLAAPASAWAQGVVPAPTAEPMQVLLAKPPHWRVRGYATSLTELSRFSGRQSLSLGGNLAVLLNRQVSVGAYALTTVTPLRGLDRGNPSALQFTQVGGLLGYSFRPRRALHIALSTHIGAGLLVRPGEVEDIVATSWVVAPQAAAELNLKRWLRASVGVGYRQVNGGGAVAEENRLSNPTLSFGLSLGWFD